MVLVPENKVCTARKDLDQVSPTPGGRRIRLGYRRAWGRLRGKGAGQRAGLGRGLSVHGPLPASLFPCDKSTALSYGLPESCEARPPSQPCPVPQPLPLPLAVWAWAECTGGQGLSEPPSPLRVARLPQRPPGSSGRCWTRATLASTAAPAATGRSSALASWLCCGLRPGASHSCLPCSGQLARGQEACVDRPGCAPAPAGPGVQAPRCGAVQSPRGWKLCTASPHGPSGGTSVDTMQVTSCPHGHRVRGEGATQGTS